MAWTISVDLLESCSCAALCPCVLGPAKPDQGWCSAVFCMQITEGDADGVDLGGVKLAIQFELPGDFLSGIDKAKMYYDPGSSAEQRAALDAVFHGERGGLWGGMREAIKEWLPSSTAAISFSDGDTAKVTVDGVGELVLKPILTEDGKRARIENAPVLAA